ncbi:MAG: NAD(P)/FAD-dependent oxidoreductase [Longimicrobiales bacterium]
MARAALHVVVLGGGFAGLNCARRLRRAPVRVTVVDRHNYHLFQPLLYQVATASLSPGDIAWPLRSVLRRQRNAEVWLGEVVAVDPERRRVQLRDGVLTYDYLIVATGATHAYFGHTEWAELAPGLKTIDDALEVRRRFLLAFESAEREADPEARRRLLTFVIVGAGPTGVELAGAMAEIARRVLPRDFRAIDTTTARILLVEGLAKVLPPYPDELSDAARRKLEELGVEVRTGAAVTDIRQGYVCIGDEEIPAANVFWAAGVAASPVAGSLGAELDRAGRVKVAPDLSVPGHPEIFVAGDLAHVEDPEQGMVPGVAQAAIQMGKHAARRIAEHARARLAGSPSPEPQRFRYKDPGNLATIGRAAAVADIRNLHFAGFFAWVIWVFIHIAQLIGFRNRIVVMVQWAWAYMVNRPGIRLITGGRQPELHRPRRSGEAAIGPGARGRAAE